MYDQGAVHCKDAIELCVLFKDVIGASSATRIQRSFTGLRIDQTGFQSQKNQGKGEPLLRQITNSKT